MTTISRSPQELVLPDMKKAMPAVTSNNLTRTKTQTPSIEIVSQSRSRYADENKSSTGVPDPLNMQIDLPVSPTTQHLYDTATWRMYYRIMNARKIRSEQLARTNRGRDRDHKGIDRTAKYEKRNFNSSRNLRHRSSSMCSETSRTDECMFPLEL